MTHLTSDTQLEEKSPSLSIGQRCRQMFVRLIKPSTLEAAQISIAALNDAIIEPEMPADLPEPEQEQEQLITQEAVGGLSPESPIGMSRIQGALSTPWNAAKGLLNRINQQRAASWSNATSRPAALIPEKPLSLPVRINNLLNQEEEVRGLDDLFPKQITDFFMEGSGNRASSNHNGMTTPAQEAAKRSKEVIRFEESLIRKVRWPYSSKTIQQAAEEKAGAEKTSEIEATATAPTMVFENGVASTEAIQLPVADQVESLSQVEDLTLEAAVEPEALQSVEMAAAASDFVPDWLIETAESVIARTSNPIIASPSPKESTKRLSVREQMAKEQDQNIDLSSLDYMARNNRILGDSISSLVDRYFQQAALEESLKAY